MADATDMRFEMSTGAMSDMIGAIYDCVLDPTRWHGVLETICREFRFKNAVLAVNGFDGQAILGAIVGVEGDWLARIMNYGTSVTDLWGGQERIMEYPLEEPIVHSRLLEIMDRSTNAYFSEWAAPQGIVDAVAIGIERNSLMVSSVSLGRHASAGDITAAEIDGLRLLAPHVRRAVNISKILDLKTIEASTFAATLERLTIGIAFVDAQNSLIHANSAANAMFADKDPVRLQAGRIVLPSAAATSALEQAVRTAAITVGEGAATGVGIPAMRSDGTPAVVHVMPLRREIIHAGLTMRPVAALFIAPSAAAPRMPVDALALLYSLTPAEARIFERIAAGDSLADIALRLGLAASTVKSHLSRVFEKTGCKRQVDLVKLAASMSVTF